MDVRLPDGTVIRNVPEGTTQTELMSRVAEMRRSNLPADASKPITPVETPAEAIAGNPATRFALGAASPILGLAQIGNRLRSSQASRQPSIDADAALARTEELKRAGMRATGDETDVAGIAGSVVSPAFLGAAKALPAATGYMGRVGQGAALGAGAGATAPVAGGNFAEQKATQIGAGAAVGAAVPGVMPLVKGAGNVAYHGLIEPWLRPAAIKGRAFLEAAGDKADDIIRLLRENKELVPGSRPIAGEAAAPAGSAEFTALQKSASKVTPSDYLARADEQNAARLAQVRTVGQTPEALAAAETQRATDASRNYGAASKFGVSTDAKLNQLLARPSMGKVFARAQELAAERGETFQIGKNAPQQVVPGKIVGEGGSPLTNTVVPEQKAVYPVNSMHYIKMAMDDLIKNPERFGIGASEAQAINGTQKEFVTWLGRKVPAYDFARSEFKAASTPINQMQIGQTLEQKLIPALDEEAAQRSGVYAQALRDAPQTIKKATGQPRFNELSQLLTEEQLAAVESVKKDLARSARYELMAKRGSQAAPNAVDLATASLEATAGGKVPNLLNRAAMVTNAIIERLQGKINKQLAAEIAVEMLYPPKVAASLAQAKANAARNKYISDQISKVITIGTTGGIHAAAQEGQ